MMPQYKKLIKIGRSLLKKFPEEQIRFYDHCRKKKLNRLLVKGYKRNISGNLKINKKYMT